VTLPLPLPFRVAESYSLRCSRSFPPCIEPQVLFPCSQELATGTVLSELNTFQTFVLSLFKIYFYVIVWNKSRDYISQTSYIIRNNERVTRLI